MTLSIEEQIDAELEALSKRLAGFHQNIKERPAMKYALESLPELIGEDQFRDICIALGVETVVQLPSGQDFASIIRSRVLLHHDQLAEQRRQRQSERFL